VTSRARASFASSEVAPGDSCHPTSRAEAWDIFRPALLRSRSPSASLVPNTVSSHWFNEPSSSLELAAPFSATPEPVDSPFLDPEVFPSPDAPDAASAADNVDRSPLAELRPLQSLTTGRRPQCVLQNCGASHEVCSPPAHEVREIHQPRACLTRFVPPPGFLSLLAACSLAYPPALFRAGSTHGVPPLQSLPLRPKPWHLSMPAALLTLPSRQLVASGWELHARCLQTLHAPLSRRPPRLVRAGRLQGLAPRRSPLPDARG